MPLRTIWRCCGVCSMKVRLSLFLLSSSSFSQKDQTPLLVAVRYGHIQCVKILLEHGADPDYCNEARRPAIAGPEKQFNTIRCGFAAVYPLDLLTKKSKSTTARLCVNYDQRSMLNRLPWICISCVNLSAVIGCGEGVPCALLKSGLSRNRRPLPTHSTSTVPFTSPPFTPITPSWSSSLPSRRTGTTLPSSRRAAAVRRMCCCALVKQKKRRLANLCLPAAPHRRLAGGLPPASRRQRPIGASSFF